MKILRKILLLMSFLFVIMTNASCAAKVFEKEIREVHFTLYARRSQLPDGMRAAVHERACPNQVNN